MGLQWRTRILAPNIAVLAQAGWDQKPWNPAAGKALAKAFYDAAFGEGRDISDLEVLLEVAAEQGVDNAELAAALKDQSVKDRFRGEVDAAFEKGVFGSPLLMVEGEVFWGHDKLPEVGRWLETGGW